MIRRYLFGWIFAAFRAAVRTEVQRYMDERRRAFAQAMPPVSQVELIGVRAAVEDAGYRVAGEVIPLRRNPPPRPTNDRHPSPPSPPDLRA